jgi:hypothetical protein
MSALKELLVRAEKWPMSAQNDLLSAALIIERSGGDEFADLDAEDYRIIAQRLSENAGGGLASDEDVEAVFGKYRAS